MNEIETEGKNLIIIIKLCKTIITKSNNVKCLENITPRVQKRFTCETRMDINVIGTNALLSERLVRIERDLFITIELR